MYARKHMTDSSNYYLLKSMESAINENTPQMIPTILINFGNQQKNPADKLKYYMAALDMPFAKVDAAVRSNVLSAIALFYNNENKIDSSLAYARLANNTAANVSFIYRIEPTWLLAQSYKKRNADSALKYTEMYYAFRDSSASASKVQRAQALEFAQQQQAQEELSQKQAYQTRLAYYFGGAVILFLVAIALIQKRSNKRQKTTNLLLSEQKEEISTQRDSLEKAFSDLKAAQNQLIQAEKMASLGELTAGIAHEIQNPLNFVNNFSEVNAELIGEMKMEIEKGDFEEVKAIALDIEENSKKISMHGKRADGIVKGMLQHSQSGSGTKEPTDINALADECMRLSYHGLRAKDKSFNAELASNFDESLPNIDAIQQDIVRVMFNLFNNAFYAVSQKQKTVGIDYKPKVSVTTRAQNGKVVISVTDNGTGIPESVKEKIMQPFFTTKPTGEGTGLGLSLSYDIVVKGHGGSIQVNSVEGEGSEFIIELPNN
jgi:signal transduction histidine kinase